MSCTLRSSFGSMYQPFLVERLILSSTPSALRLTPPHDVLLRGLIAPRLVAHGWLAPGRLRLAANRRLALTTPMGMVAGVHRRAAHVRPPAQPATPTGFTDLERPVLRVAYGPDRRHAGDLHAAHLPARQAQGRPVAFLGHELRPRPSAAHHLGAAAGLQLDVVDHGARGDVAECQRIARIELGLGPGHHARPDPQPGGRDDVALLAVRVFQEGDARRAVRIVFDGPYLGSNPELVSLPIDDAIEALVAAAAVSDGNAPLRVAPAPLLQRLGKRLLRPRGRDLRERVAAHPSPAGRGRLIFLNRHATPPRIARCDHPASG